MRLHQLMQQNQLPNCPELAKEFETSTRTIKRDVDFMKCRLNLPIEYDNQRYGYYYSKPVAQFPNFAVTESELFALLVAHKAIAQYQGTALQQPLEAAFRKLTGQLDQEGKFTLGNLEEALSFRPFAPADTDLTTFQALTTALREKRTVEFQYKNLGAKSPQLRQVHPHHIACIDNHWYLFAFDVNRAAMRTFVLTRLSKLVLTKKKFTRQRSFNADEYLRGSFQVFKGGDDYEVVIDFDNWATDLIRGRKWHASQELMELKDGTSRLKMRLNNLEEIEGWVLSWGVHATVVRPAELMKRIGRIAEQMAYRYKGAEK